MFVPVNQIDRNLKRKEMNTQNRNDKCSCGSGLKYKNCCLNKENYYNKETNPMFAIPSKAILFRGSPATTEVPADLSTMESVSFHYKGDQFDNKEGINLNVRKGQPGFQPKDIIEMCELSHKGFMKCYKEEGESFIKEMIGQLEEYIKINLAIDESTVNYLSNSTKEEIIKMQSIILMNIWSLTKIGIIKDDEYNGVNWNRLHINN